MKKALAILMTCILLATLAACGGSSSGGDVIKIGVYEPQTGDNGIPLYLLLMLLISVFGTTVAVRQAAKKNEK